MVWYPVGTTDDIPVGSKKIVDINGRSIGVYNVHGKYYAILNYCPHQGAELCKGPVCGTTLDSEVYEFIYGRDQEIIRCPWHGWEFDITTGKSLFSDRIRVRSYQAALVDGQICVEIGNRGETK